MAGLLDPSWVNDPERMLAPAAPERQWSPGAMPMPRGAAPPAAMPEMRGLPQGPPAGQPESPLRMPMPSTPPAAMPGGGEDPRQTILGLFKRYGLV